MPNGIRGTAPAPTPVPPTPVDQDAHANTADLLQRAAADYSGNKPKSPASQPAA